MKSNVPEAFSTSVQLDADCELCDLIRDLEQSGWSQAAMLLRRLQESRWTCEDLHELVCRGRLDLALDDVDARADGLLVDAN